MSGRATAGAPLARHGRGGGGEGEGAGGAGARAGGPRPLPTSSPDPNFASALLETGIFACSIQLLYMRQTPNCLSDFALHRWSQSK